MTYHSNKDFQKLIDAIERKHGKNSYQVLDRGASLILLNAKGTYYTFDRNYTTKRNEWNICSNPAERCARNFATLTI